MKRFEKTVVGVLVASFLIQPLGLITVVRAEEVRMEYSDPDHLHAPHQVTIDGVSNNYQYDANGNLVSDGEREIEWNQDNKPIRITREVDGETQVVEFFYDASGRRILKRSFLESDPSDVDTTTYVSSAYQKSVVDGVETTTKYYFANGRRIAVRNAIAGEDELTFLHQDHLGSTILATDSDSQPTSNSLSYFPYGNHLTIQPFSHSSYLFTGQESDPESDLYNYNARLYNPTTGIFISADSVQGPNRYAYAANNPMVFVDPSGNQTTDPTDPETDLPVPGILATGTIGGDTSQSPLSTPLILDGDWGEGDQASELERLWGIFKGASGDLAPRFGKIAVSTEITYILLRLLHYTAFVEDISPADAQLIVNEFMAATGKVVKLHFEMPEGAPSVAGGMRWLKDGVHNIYLAKMKEYFLQHELGHTFWEELTYTLKDYWVNLPKVRQSEMAADKYAYELLKEAGNTWGARAAYSRYLLHRFWGAALEAWVVMPPPTLPPVPIYIDFGSGYCPPGGAYPCGGNTDPVSN